jgi:hypothetical protein
MSGDALNEKSGYVIGHFFRLLIPTKDKFKIGQEAKIYSVHTPCDTKSERGTGWGHSDYDPIRFPIQSYKVTV